VTAGDDGGDLAGLEGRRLGRYVLHSVIARGGMGVVYRAQLEGERGFGKWVALKLIHPHLAGDARRAAMFLDEARVAARIHHPNVCSVLDYGEHQGVPYLVMEYLHGQSFETVAERGWADGELPLWLAARLVADAARGLHAAHELTDEGGQPLHVVHRDVSPQNVQVLYDGVAKVMDFGVARARGRLAVTQTGEVKGKLAFMAPEQIEDREVDRRADVWSLGVLLWEATVGERLFHASSEGATVRNVLDKPVPAPGQRREGYPEELEAAVLDALARDPAVRTPDAAALADALEDFLYGQGRPAGPAQVAEWMQQQFGAGGRDEPPDGAPSTGVAEVPEVDLTSAARAEAETRPSIPSSGRGQVRTVQRRPRPRRGWTVAKWAFAAGVLLIAGSTALWFAAEPTEPGPSARSNAAESPDGPDSQAAHASAHRSPSPSPMETPPGDGSARRPRDEHIAKSSGADASKAADRNPERERGRSRAARPERPRPAQAGRKPPNTERARARNRAGASPPKREAPSDPPTKPDSDASAKADSNAASESDSPRETGTLNLLAIPAARVRMGDRVLGTTPLAGIELPAGQHALTLEPVGGGSAKHVQVQIEPGERTRVSYTLDTLR
jgi:serine/threonine-protein kinase